MRTARTTSACFSYSRTSSLKGEIIVTRQIIGSRGCAAESLSGSDSADKSGVRP